MSIIGNGSNVLVFDANGSPIACQKNVNVTFNDEVIDVTCKQSNGYSEFLPGKRNFSMTCEALTDWGQNLLLWSEEFDNAVWNKPNSSVVANNTLSPNNTLTADKLIADGTNNTHALIQLVSSLSPNWTFSVYAKANGYDRLILNTNNTNYVGFNLTTGIIESTLGTNITDATIESVGNGWYRCSISSTTTATGASVVINVYNTTYTNGNDPITFTGNGTSGIYVWGAQLNTGTTVQSYYQTTSTVNPNIDTLVSANLNRTKIELNIANPAFDDIYFNGEAYIESIEQNAGTEDVASYTVTFSGTGDLVSLVS